MQACVGPLPFSACSSALYTLCGFYIHAREPKAIQDLLRFHLFAGTVCNHSPVAQICSVEYLWGAEVIPLLLLGMTIAVAYQQEMALILAASVALVISFSIGLEMYQSIVLLATVAGAILVLKQVRTRGKLLSVGGMPPWSHFLPRSAWALCTDNRVWNFGRNGLTLALWSVIAGPLMTVLLPAVERVFNVQTDLSLIELGDPAHPLLQELIRRAPGTYNHSITVASLAEVRRGINRGSRTVGPSGGVLSRHWQDAQAGLFCRKSEPWSEPPRFVGARDEHAGDHRPR